MVIGARTVVAGARGVMGALGTGVLKSIGSPAPTESNPGTRSPAGTGGVEASCKVASAAGYEVEAEIASTASLYTPETLGLTSDQGVPCTLDASRPPLEVKAGTLYTEFECEALTAAPSTLCGAKGVIVLEFCEE